MTIATSPSAISLADLNTTINHEPRIKDVRIGERLGMAQPLNIRASIERNRVELGGFAPIHTAYELVTHGSRASRKITVYWLNEPQTLLLCMLSRTPAAAAVRREVIEVFMAYRRGEIPVRAHTRRRPSPAVPPALVMPEIQAYAVRRHLALLAQYLGRQGELGRRVTALENLLQGLHSFTGERDSRLIRVLPPDIAKDAAARNRFLATTQTPPAKPAESRPSIGYRPEEVFPSLRPAGGVTRERAPKPQPPETQAPELCGVRWDDPEAVEALLYSMRVKREVRRQPVPITPERAAELHREGTIGPRQWARLARHIVRRIK